jgi:hypothetical protein
MTNQTKPLLELPAAPHLSREASPAERLKALHWRLHLASCVLGYIRRHEEGNDENALIGGSLELAEDVLLDAVQELDKLARAVQ